MASQVDINPGMTGRDGADARLTRKERALLRYLREHAGRCVSREALLRDVWGYRQGVRSRTLDVHVQRLRKKLGPAAGGRILTVFRSGYLWSPEPGESRGVSSNWREEEARR